ncbi:AAA family ATPase [Desulfohalobiaceae bacterium Ax17]|uniref:ATP-binding protein n=1 Tax=Desulfovulcanus ferrireducens TaxID=2831190 RepID=UPI00207BA756|nr:carbon monoxide dehydrogenase accessory protein CooC [Desulfovulcanus ferrireducens]MBT8762821.1 AAA family ATPase [Desulfovulcanus ferrireducens]
MKIAVTGKGGVGKTTVAGILARLFSDEGYRVLAVDADPDANLASALGIPESQYKKITPFSKMKKLAEERTGASGGYGSYFILNPKVDDLPEKYCVEHQGVKLLLMGTVEQGGSGCFCPEHALLKSLMKHLLIEREDVVIMDMEAGIEHLGRGTAESVDALLVVVEPGRRSIQTAMQIKSLAEDLGLKRVFAVGSKVVDEADVQFIRKNLVDLELLGFVYLSEEVKKADLEGVSPFDVGGMVVEGVRSIKARLVAKLNN